MFFQKLFNNWQCQSAWARIAGDWWQHQHIGMWLGYHLKCKQCYFKLNQALFDAKKKRKKKECILDSVARTPPGVQCLDYVPMRVDYYSDLSPSSLSLLAGRNGSPNCILRTPEKWILDYYNSCNASVTWVFILQRDPLKKGGTKATLLLCCASLRCWEKTIVQRKIERRKCFLNWNRIFKERFKMGLKIWGCGPLGLSRAH